MTFLPAYAIIEPRAGAARRTAWILHGILGSGRNWRGFAQRLAEALGDWAFVLVDLRNHGDSTGAPPPHTLGACAADVARLSRHLGRPVDALIGHSFGGKVAMVFARDEAPKPASLWVLDSPPGAVDEAAEPRETRDVERVVALLRALPMPVGDRRDVVTALTGAGLSMGIAQWMTTNLKPVPGGYGWKFDLAAVETMRESYYAEDLWPLLEAPPEGTRRHVVVGGRSDRWSAEDRARLEALDGRGAIALHTLASAGHWVHVDAPDALAGLIEADLRALA